MADAPFVSYAQHGEDVVLWRALGGRDGVTYVDVGAFHPSDDSVTRALYERGWRGVNIEAQPDRLAAFEEQRPQDTNLALAVGDTDGTITLTLPDNPGWASTLPADATGADPASAILEVPVRRLDTLLPELGIEHVDVLKIDVEGAEPAVVRGLLGGAVRPVVCVVEGVAPGLGRAAGDEAVRLLVEAGYTHCMFDGLNHYLTTDPDLVDALSVPASPVDGYRSDLEARLMNERTALHEVVAHLTRENIALRTGAGAPTPAPPAPPGGRAPGVADGAAEPQPSTTARREPRAAGPGSGGAAGAPSALDAADVTRPIRIQAVLRLDADTRTRRRRAMFERFLRGAPAEVAAAPSSPLARLLRLAVEEFAPADAVGVLYREILGREADPDGQAHWSRRVEAGEPLLRLARELAASAEARARPAERQAKVRADLAAWESLLAVTELGAAAWQPHRAYTPGRVADELFVAALFEVAYQRQPSTAELQHEVAKLEAGVGREWLLRAFARSPQLELRLFGRPSAGWRSTLRRLRDRRHRLAIFRAMVSAAENRQVETLLAALTSAEPLRGNADSTPGGA